MHLFNNLFYFSNWQIWGAITNNLNVQYGGHRTTLQVGNKFKDMGKDVRKQRDSIRKTEGGGTVVPVWYTDHSLRIIGDTNVILDGINGKRNREATWSVYKKSNGGGGTVVPVWYTDHYLRIIGDTNIILEGINDN